MPEQWVLLQNCGSEQAFFVIRGEGGGGILEEAGTFSGQALLLSYPYPRGGGGPVKEAGTHSPPCPQYLPNIKPHAMHQITLNLFPHKISAQPSLLQLAP